MDLGHRERNAIAAPGFTQWGKLKAAIRFKWLHAHRLGIHIDVAAIPARRVAGIEMDVMIEEVLAGQILVDADQVGFAALRFRRRLKGQRRNPRVDEETIKAGAPGSTRPASRSRLSQRRWFSCAA